MRIMDCCLLLFQKKLNPVEMDPDRPCVKPSWSEALKMMNNSGFLATLLNFSKVRFSLLCFYSLVCGAGGGLLVICFEIAKNAVYVPAFAVKHVVFPT